MKGKFETALRWNLTAAVLVSIVAVFVLVLAMGAGQRGALHQAGEL